MIVKENVARIGRLLKPHGIKGEITLLFDKEPYGDIETDFYFVEIDGIFVPFFVEEMRFASDISARVKFEDIDDESAASRYANLPVYIPRETLETVSEASVPDWDFFVGYAVTDETLGHVGVIEAVDSATLNVLFIVKDGNSEYFIPATEDFITEINESEKIVRMQLPEGLIEK